MQRIQPLVLPFVLVACAAPESAPSEPAAGESASAAHEPEVVASAQPAEPAAPAASESPSVATEPQVVVPAETSGAPRARRAARTARTDGALLEWEKQELARSAFATLTPDEQLGLVEALAIECKNIQTFQMGLVRFVLALEEVDPGLRPDAAPVAWFDPATHAAAQPIARSVLAPDEPSVIQAEREILGALEPRRAESGWAYDWGRREVVRLANERDAWRMFENALLGLPPYWDLVEALVEQKLDDGSYQKAFAAFAHVYTDRVGGVYPRITLYDAWASHAAIEMPDVDTLGIVHDVLGDWDTWKSIVPEAQHPSLYGRIGELFMPAHHFRGLRHSLARTFVCGSTELRDGYQQHIENFHALWESASSDPAVLATRLPDDAHWAEFLLGITDRTAQDETYALRGIRRRYTLDRNGDEVRRYLYWLLEQADAYRRLGAAK